MTLVVCKNKIIKIIIKTSGWAKDYIDLWSDYLHAKVDEHCLNSYWNNRTLIIFMIKICMKLNDDQDRCNEHAMHSRTWGSHHVKFDISLHWFLRYGWKRTRTHAWTHAHTHTYAHTNTHTRMHTHTQHTHTYIHTRKNTQTHTHTYIYILWPRVGLCYLFSKSEDYFEIKKEKEGESVTLAGFPVLSRALMMLS